MRSVIDHVIIKNVHVFLVFLSNRSSNLLFKDKILFIDLITVDLKLLTDGDEHLRGLQKLEILCFWDLWNHVLQIVV